MRSSSAGRSGLSRTGAAGALCRMESNRAAECLAAEWERAGGHLVKYGAEGEKVGAAIEFLAQRLLGRHVGDRAERGAWAGEVLLIQRPAVASSRTVSVRPAIGVSLASPKSRILAWPRLVMKMLAGLMSRCTMPSAWAASSASAISMASDRRARGLDRAPGDAVLERHAVQEFHGDEGMAFVFADVVDSADVGMIQSRGRLRFALETGEGLRVAGNVIGQEFQSDETVQAGVFGLVDHTHAAAAELFDNAVVRDGLADHRVAIW